MKIMKRITSNIKSLPREILAEILTYAASNSTADFVNVRRTCKDFLKASNEYQILENVSMEKFSPIPWQENERVFLERCSEAKNAEALYRKGMLNCFSRRKGLQYLKKAADKGHTEAIYTYGVVLICLGGDLKNKGFQVLSSFNLTSSETSVGLIARCRSKTENLLSNMWVKVTLARPEGTTGCDLCNDGEIAPIEQDLAWEASNNLLAYYNNSLSSCSHCFWNREATLFSRMLRNYYTG